MTQLGPDFVVLEHGCCVRFEGGWRRPQYNSTSLRELYLPSLPLPWAVWSQAYMGRTQSWKKRILQAYRCINTHFKDELTFSDAQIPAGAMLDLWAHDIPSIRTLIPPHPNQTHTPRHLQWLGEENVVTLDIKHPSESLWFPQVCALCKILNTC